MSDLATKLHSGLKVLKLNATEEQQSKLLLLLEQLVKWNKTYNLTAIKTAEEGLTLHLLDSLVVVPYIQQKTIIDVGTGAGFPGLPLAIMLPNVKFTLLDSNSKKIRFIRQQIHLLGLENVTVVDSRVEDFTTERFEAVISRAFASINDMTEMTQQLLTENGRWLAMKGLYSQQEIADCVVKVEEIACHSLEIPGLSAERCLIELEPA